MKKKVLSVLLSAVMVMALAAGCGAPAASDDGGSDKKEDYKREAIAKEDLKVGFVHIGDASDMGYTYNHEQGTKEMQKNIGLKDEQIITKYNVPEGSECETALRELAEAGCNIIFATSFGHEDYVMEVAADYPEPAACTPVAWQNSISG